MVLTSAVQQHDNVVKHWPYIMGLTLLPIWKHEQNQILEMSFYPIAGNNK